LIELCKSEKDEPSPASSAIFPSKRSPESAIVSAQRKLDKSEVQ
jgi:hypothetical protein